MASRSDELVRAFVELHRLNAGDRSERLASDAHFWASERVAEVMATGGHEAVDLIDELLHAKGTDDSYNGLVGAGPLQDLLYSHGSAVADVIAERCRLDPAWRRAISTVIGSELPEVVRRSLRNYMPHAG